MKTKNIERLAEIGKKELNEKMSRYVQNVYREL